MHAFYKSDNLSIVRRVFFLKCVFNCFLCCVKVSPHRSICPKRSVPRSTRGMMMCSCRPIFASTQVCGPFYHTRIVHFCCLRSRARRESRGETPSGEWLEKRHGVLKFRPTQVITGHGCFGSFRCRIGREETPGCHHCADRPENTVEICPT